MLSSTSTLMEKSLLDLTDARRESRIRVIVHSEEDTMSGFRQYLRLLWLTLFHSRGTFARPTLKRVGGLLILVPLLLILQACHWLGFLLDEVFFRKYRAVKIRTPVFILGLPRSGTTFLHRMLARDTGNYTTMQLWEMILAPSITERKILMALAEFDRRLGGFGRRLLGAFDERVFAGGSKIHKISLFQPEEDEMLLLPLFSSIFLLHLFPFPQALWHLVHFDSATPSADKHRIMSFYRRCVQRHLYVHGPDKHFLSKNPAFASRIDALDEYFPDAKVICNLRDPFRAVPSMLSYIHYIWGCLDNDPRGCFLRDRLLEMAVHWYQYPMERLAYWPDNRYAIVRYDDLTANPNATTRDLYARLGIEISPAFAERLREEYLRSRTYRSEHTYSLSQYGLTPMDIIERFQSVIAYYDLAPDCPQVNFARAGDDLAASSARL
jgi:omega-hydroxy-beta-dihydromenaquinone-9 sulfotransferase